MRKPMDEIVYRGFEYSSPYFPIWRTRNIPRNKKLASHIPGEILGLINFNHLIYGDGSPRYTFDEGCPYCEALDNAYNEMYNPEELL